MAQDGILMKSFGLRLSEITKEDIIKLSENDAPIYNVVRGFHNESFGIYLWDDSKPNFDYYLAYVTTRNNNKLEGLFFKLQPYLKSRNKLTNYFACYICNRYNIKDPIPVFNAYQLHQQTLFDKLNFWPYDDDFIDELKAKGGDLILKNVKGLIYVPTAKERPEAIKASGKMKQGKNDKDDTKKKKDIEKINYVYIMHNKRTNHYKIGRSNNPKFRERTLQSQEPDVIVTHQWAVSEVWEGELHRKFKEKRLRGEWFALTEEDIINTNDFMNNVLDEMKRKTKHG